MSQRIGPFLAGIGVVTAAYISGRVIWHGYRSGHCLYPPFCFGMRDVPVQALIWDRAEKISEAWPCAPPPKQPLPVRTSSLKHPHQSQCIVLTWWHDENWR